jgi:hypothetical protein
MFRIPIDSKEEKETSALRHSQLVAGGSEGAQSVSDAATRIKSRESGREKNSSGSFSTCCAFKND